MIVSSVVLVITQSISVSLRFGICTDQLFFVLSSTGGNWWQLVAKLVATGGSCHQFCHYLGFREFASDLQKIICKMYSSRYGQTLLIYDSTIMKYDQIPIAINVSKTEISRFRIADLSSKIRWIEGVGWSDLKKNIKKVWKSIILDRCKNL